MYKSGAARDALLALLLGSRCQGRVKFNVLVPCTYLKIKLGTYTLLDL